MCIRDSGLIWGLMHDPAVAVAALAALDPADLDGLSTAGILRQARSLQGWDAGAIPAALVERLTKGEAVLVQEIAAQGAAPGTDITDCAQTLAQLRQDRIKAELQREIVAGAALQDDEMNALLRKKLELLRLKDRAS